MTKQNTQYQDFNSVTVSGNLTADPKISTVSTSYGQATKAIFCLANNQDNGKVNWINIQTLGRKADVAKQLKKGQQATIIGKLTTSKNQNTGFTYTYVKPVRINVPLKSATKSAPKIPVKDLPF